MKKRLLLITGKPGTGKTTVLCKTIESLKGRGFSVGGMVSCEVRSGATRVGFEILDLSKGGKGWLAHVDQKWGPRVGRYRVNMDDLNDIGVCAIADAVEKADVVAVDEIGPMELYSRKFKEVVRKAVESRKLLIGTVHWRVKNGLIQEMRSREDAEVYTVTYENRGELHKKIIRKGVEYLGKTEN